LLPQATSKIFLVDRPGSVQTNLVLGNLAIDRNNPDYPALRVMNQVLGGGSNGRLFRNIREEKGYTYGAYSRIEAGRFVGPWAANSEVRSEVSGPALGEFFVELKRVAQEPIPADELEAAKRSMVANFALSLESPASILNYAVQSEQYGFPADYWETYPQKLMAVTAADAQRVAKKYYGTDAVQVIAVGDAANIRTQIDKYGTVSVYDLAGKPVMTGTEAAK
jgi:predicted Zn-dependent peptidase